MPIQNRHGSHLYNMSSKQGENLTIWHTYRKCSVISTGFRSGLRLKIKQIGKNDKKEFKNHEKMTGKLKYDCAKQPKKQHRFWKKAGIDIPGRFQ